MRSRLLRPFAAWLALLALALSALAPAISHAVGSAAPAGFIEVCTENGMRLVAVDAHGTPEHGAPGTGHGQGQDHCPACLLPIQGFTPPDGQPQAPSPSALSHVLPRAFLQAPTTQHVWLAAQPRGPPVQG